MTTALIIGGVLLVGVGLVASQLFRLKDWLNRQPPPDPEDPSLTGPAETPPSMSPPSISPPGISPPNGEEQQ